ncbi:MAG: hypothetical protein DHS20C04_00440 [Hyphococcus sp.]|nr:MAG: hypothetical protein DHS20C04_00440 [Marinicaulis sp.]
MVFITFALPLRAEDLGGTAIQIGALYSIFTISVFVIRPLTGVGLDAIGRRPFFLAAALFYFAANLFYATNSSIEGLYVARALQGFGFAILAITTEAITSDITDARTRAAAMGANIASQTRGGMVGATVGFTLVGMIPLYAWAYSFWIFTAVSVGAIAIAAGSLPETAARQRGTPVRQSFSMPPQYLQILAIIFSAAFAGALIQPYYLIYLRARFDVELYMLALAFLPIGVAYAALPSLLGRFSDKIHRASAIALGLVLTATFYGLVPIAGGFFWVIGAFLAAAIGSVLLDLTKNAWVADISVEGTIGRTFGLAALASGGGAATGPLAGGYIYDAYGPDYLFFAAAIILFGVALVAIALRPRTSAI